MAGPFFSLEASMRPAILSMSLFLLAACGEEAPAPATEPAPADQPAGPPPAPEPEPVVEPAMVDCVDLSFAEGAEAQFGAPVEEGEEHAHEEGAHVHHGGHVKHHFEMPEGKDALVVDVTWPNHAWNLEVTTGLGGCPHSGTTYATVAGLGSAHLYVPASALGEDVATFEAGSGWFVHLANKGSEAAEPVAVSFAAKACVIEKAEVEAEAVKALPPTIKPGAPKAVERGPKAIGVEPVMKGKAGKAGK
jgi:hypothetical protein